MKLLKLVTFIVEQAYKLSNTHTNFLEKLYMKLINIQVTNINKRSK